MPSGNYILTEIEKRSMPLETVLAEAQEVGYAEADASADRRCRIARL